MAQDIIVSLKKQYQGKKVLVVGLGLQGGGVGVVKFFAELGAIVTVTDKKPKEKLLPSINSLSNLPITFHLGGHTLLDFQEADVIFKGPSVPWSMTEIIEAQKKGIPVEMELSFFTRHFPGKTIGITGTRGKSTTTNLIFNLLKQSGYPVYLGGGIPDISTINYLKTLTKDDWAVMELSSWALSGFHRDKISPHISVFTNIYPDHLNYYKNMGDYLYDKKAIYLYQRKEDFLVINSNARHRIFESTSPPKGGSPKSLTQKQVSSLLPIDSSIVLFSKNDFPYPLIYLKGDHNLENAAAALQAAKILNIDEQIAINSISNFKGLPYRQEIVRELNGITFVNDTTSTTPIATLRAIDSFKDKKIILILGGNSKNLPSSDLIERLNEVEKIVLLSGSFTDEIINTLKVKVPKLISEKIYNNLKEAIIESYRLAKEQGTVNITVLFSPGATSFAMFNNEFHRGDEFNRIVKELI